MDSAKHTIEAFIAENIFLSFGNKEVLKGVTIKIEQGKITGLLGRNGSGKSLMLRVIFGIQKANDASIIINGKKITHAYTLNSLINYLPQKPFLPPDRKLKKILADYGITDEQVYELFPELIHDKDKTVNEIPGGKERLWAVIILLLADTKYTLLDEPFSHIMPLHIERLTKLILQQKSKKGIVITDHMYHHLLPVSDSLYLMKDGKSIFIRDNQDLVLHGYLNTLEE